MTSIYSCFYKYWSKQKLTSSNLFEGTSKCQILLIASLKILFPFWFHPYILLFQKFSFPRECQCLSWYDWFAKWELLRFDKWPKPASGEQTPSNHFHPLPFNFGQNIIWNWKVKLYKNLYQNFLHISDVIKYIIP